jgi:hypothetical protein
MLKARVPRHPGCGMRGTLASGNSTRACYFAAAAWPMTFTTASG